LEPANSGPSLTRAPDRSDRRGEGFTRSASAPADVHTHALFPTESQSFLGGRALQLKKNEIEHRGVSRSANRIPTVLTRSAPEFARRSQPAKFRFPDHEMERPKQRLSAFRLEPEPAPAVRWRPIARTRASAGRSGAECRIARRGRQSRIEGCKPRGTGGRSGFDQVWMGAEGGH